MTRVITKVWKDIGRRGSGKTSSSGNAIVRAMANLPESAVLILCAKPEDSAPSSANGGTERRRK